LSSQALRETLNLGVGFLAAKLVRRTAPGDPLLTYVRSICSRITCRWAGRCRWVIGVIATEFVATTLDWKSWRLQPKESLHLNCQGIGIICQSWSGELALALSEPTACPHAT
jgi:hypothetical protein